MPTYIPRKGDYVAATFDPQSGHEQKGRRPALVISNDLFNRHTGLAIVCPITNIRRDYPFHVAIADSNSVTGVVMVDQVKSICKTCGRPPLYIRNIQKALKLPVSDKAAGCSISYVQFLKKVVALRALNVPMDTIASLLDKEKALLRVLKIDALGNYETWYLDQCGVRGNREGRLLLTGYDVGFPLSQAAIQTHLDFGQRDQELFAGKDMGEDARRAMEAYARAANEIRSRVRREQPVLKYALQWAREYCGD
ncbi:MAG: type II toxin-antitoxin system PemK/MazF family toxin [Lentisphaerae bacterium]|nr:type II toxin-antitoxin system PemK/MazF family toxin [Lentisphaerota bacterium]